MKLKQGAWVPLRQAALAWANADSEDDRAFELAKQRLEAEVERLLQARLARRAELEAKAKTKGPP